MSKPIRRSLSMEDINANPSAPIYRNPLRDELAEDQSILDRSSLGQSVRYEVEENPNNENNKERPPQLPQRNNTIIDRINNKPNRPAIAIEPYDIYNKCESLVNWFKNYERTAAANHWSEEDKASRLYFSMTSESRDFFEEIFDEEDKSYSELKDLILQKCRCDLMSELDLQNLNNRKYREGKGNEKEPFEKYFAEKKILLNIFDEDMPFKRQKQYIILGLPEPIRFSVQLGMRKDPPKNLTELKEHIKFVISVMPVESKENKTVRFDLNSQPRRNFSNSRAGYSRFPSDNDYRQNQFGQSSQNNRSFGQNIRSFGNNNFNNQNRFNNHFRNDSNRYFNSNPPNRNNNRYYEGKENNPNGFVRNGIYRDNSQPNSNISRNENNFNRNNPIVRRNDNNGQDTNSKDNVRPTYQRTPEGIPICYVCNEAGHTSYKCPNKNKNNAGN